MFYTGDGAARDEHGYIWIKGRVDGTVLVFCSGSDHCTYIVTDVINVSGHRLSTSEIESALARSKGVAECAGVSEITRDTSGFH